VFISYRSADNASFAGRIYDRLQEEFPGHIFNYVEHVEGGEHFERLIKDMIARCGIVVVVIGENWLSLLKEKRLQDNTMDYVVMEIKTALLHESKILPVLINQVTMPERSFLPHEISGLAASNAVVIRDSHFGQDFRSLLPLIAEAIQRLPRSFLRRQVAPWLMGLVGMMVFEAMTTAFGSVMVWSMVDLIALIPAATIALSFLKPLPPRIGIGMTILFHIGALITLLVVLEIKWSRPLVFSQDAIYFAMVILCWIVFNAVLVARINKRSMPAAIARLRKGI
jgi:hypothetical protein